MPGRMDVTMPRDGVRVRGYIRTQLAIALEVPDGDVAAGLCTLRCAGYTQSMVPVYEATAALTAMRDYYRRMVESNEERYRQRALPMHRDFAERYRARLERCERMLKEMDG